MTKKKFVVTVDSYYLRDTQILNPEGVINLPDAESDEHLALYMNDNNWQHFHQDAFLGIYDWCDTDADGLKKHVAKKRGFCPEVICVIEV